LIPLDGDIKKNQLFLEESSHYLSSNLSSGLLVGGPAVPPSPAVENVISDDILALQFRLSTQPPIMSLPNSLIDVASFAGRYRCNDLFIAEIASLCKRHSPVLTARPPATRDQREFYGRLGSTSVHTLLVDTITNPFFAASVAARMHLPAGFQSPA
jgi:hypothetical protein